MSVSYIETRQRQQTRLVLEPCELLDSVERNDGRLSGQSAGLLTDAGRRNLRGCNLPVVVVSRPMCHWLQSFRERGFEEVCPTMPGDHDHGPRRRRRRRNVSRPQYRRHDFALLRLRPSKQSTISAIRTLCVVRYHM